MMKKPEREALREYVDAVCQHSQSNLGIPGVDGQIAVIVRSGHMRTLSLDEYQTESADRLNAADDRLRALGMLP